MADGRRVARDVLTAYPTLMKRVRHDAEEGSKTTSPFCNLSEIIPLYYLSRNANALTDIINTLHRFTSVAA